MLGNRIVVGKVCFAHILLLSGEETSRIDAVGVPYERDRPDSNSNDALQQLTKQITQSAYAPSRSVGGLGTYEKHPPCLNPSDAGEILDDTVCDQSAEGTAPEATRDQNADTVDELGLAVPSRESIDAGREDSRLGDAEEEAYGGDLAKGMDIGCAQGDDAENQGAARYPPPWANGLAEDRHWNLKNGVCDEVDGESRVKVEASHAQLGFESIDASIADVDSVNGAPEVHELIQGYSLRRRLRAGIPNELTKMNGMTHRSVLRRTIRIFLASNTGSVLSCSTRASGPRYQSTKADSRSGLSRTLPFLV